MPKHIGIVACSAEGAALCYRTICTEAPKIMGEHRHPEISMHTHSLGKYMIHIRKRDWEEVAKLMLSSANKLVRIGAEFAICPDNTIHQAFEFVVEQSPIPWIHIAEVVAEEAKKNGYIRLAILGTKYLMAGPVYPETLKKFSISYEIPDEEDRIQIDNIIFQELVNGILTEKSRLYFNEVIQQLKEKGCDATVLGCTEMPLIVDPNDCPLPTLDSTRLLARAAIKEAVA
ncbi:MAG: amino acid racemase [bacterium]|nr:MAG: amino acid racemase [bacterium]